jgi:hypothetical protein
MLRIGSLAVVVALLAAPVRENMVVLSPVQGQEGGKLQVEVKAFKHSATCPTKCTPCGEAMAKALEWLAKAQQGGAIQAGNGGTVVITCIAALAWMANGSTPTAGPYSKNVVSAMQYVCRTVAPGNKNKGKTASGMEFEGFGNWDLGYAAIFLSEYYAQAPTPALKEKLEFLVQKMVDQREPNKGWGHAPNFAYKDLVVVSSACLGGLGSIKNLCGVAVPDEAIQGGVKYLQDSSAGGTVGYSPRNGQKGWGHAGRASGAAWAMARAGITDKYAGQVGAFIKQDLKNLIKDHASPTLHYLWGGLWSYMAGPELWREYKTAFLDWWLSGQQADGSFKCPTEADVKASLGMDTDAMVGPCYPTAVYALVFALPFEKTNLHRVKTKKGGGPTPTKGLGLGKKEPTNAWLGMHVKPIEGLALQVTHVKKDSPAEKAGFEAETLIVEINKKAVKDVKAAREILNALKPGTKITITIMQAGEKKAVEITVGEKPGVKPDLPDPDADPGSLPEKKDEGTASVEGEEI